MISHLEKGSENIGLASDRFHNESAKPRNGLADNQILHLIRAFV
jgi:hypothetical protein